MKDSSLRPFFYPQAIAVVGASRDAGAIGNKVLVSLKGAGFSQPIYPINPKSSEIASLKVYPSIREVPGPVDLAVICVPADKVSKVVDDCHAAGVKALVVVSAGFAEVGASGRTAEQELLKKVRDFGMRMVGPNCFGVINTDPSSPVNASFSSIFALPGSIAMASQSGAMGIVVLAMARSRQTGLSMFVSMGNKADVSSNDLIEYWERDARTKVILLYLESFGNPTRFAKIARRVGRTKPIIALKSGRTGAGSRAAGSHTAALAANDTAVDSLFRQCGVLRVETVEEMFQLAIALDSQAPPKSGKVAILTNAGGPAILCADACEAGGLEVVSLSDDVRRKLQANLQPAASVANPVDMVASATPAHYKSSIEILLGASEVDALIIIHAVIDKEIPEGLMTAIAKGIVAGRKASRNKPVFLCLLKDETVPPPLPLPGEKIPVFRFPEEPARALGRMLAYSRWRMKPEGSFPDSSMIDVTKVASVLTKDSVAVAGEGKQWLPPSEVRTVLKAAGITSLNDGQAMTSDEAVALSKKIGFPVAMKLISRRITHKTDVGGVVLGIDDGSAVRAAFDKINKVFALHASGEEWQGVLIQPMVKSGTEIFIGMTRDPVFGPLIGFGLGGVLVEVLSDVRFRLAPLSVSDAEEMIRETKGYRLLQGYRGSPPADMESLKDLLLRVSLLAQNFPEMMSLDLNPVIALAPGEGYLVLDARIEILARPK